MPPASTANFFGQALEAFGIAPDLDLAVMRPGQSLPRLTARLLCRLETYLASRRPSLVLGHGDTTTCLAAALSAFYQHTPFFHVEAGLRSGNLLAPYPEEFNRRSVAPLASHHFAPTSRERQNLREAGVADGKISVTGSTIPDAVRAAGLGQDRCVRAQPTVLVTLHRRESLTSLDETLRAIAELAQERSDLSFLCPLHPNPLVQTSFRRNLQSLPNVTLREPLKYGDFLRTLAAARLVMTDSGGVQEEAAFLGKQVLLARGETERNDGLAEGLVHLGGRDPDRFKSLARKLLSVSVTPASQPASPASHASRQIAARVREAL